MGYLIIIWSCRFRAQVVLQGGLYCSQAINHRKRRVPLDSNNLRILKYARPIWCVQGRRRRSESKVGECGKLGISVPLNLTWGKRMTCFLLQHDRIRDHCDRENKDISRLTCQPFSRGWSWSAANSLQVHIHKWISCNCFFTDQVLDPLILSRQ